MIFHETPIAGVLVVEPERFSDQRGFFARTWCEREFADHGLNTRLVQCNISYNHKRGTLRGMHWQAAPAALIKLVRCTAGAIFDVVVDMRLDSPTFKQWFGIELSAQNRTALYIPEEIAHGFLTLTDEAEVFYQMSEFHAPACERGVRWDDPAFSIQWPGEVTMINERDRNYPDFML
ncbi:MAG: dTDP-4-dehydrorhamnose 3,5-epimerase [Chloroflexaceae bacterium]|nr:dTDP-4-dehydrorhamnose 3,5-epimerase [Chloroflexaceae bacterium]